MGVKFANALDYYVVPRSEYDTRVGTWHMAPFHDEIWDGNQGRFRDRELSDKELKKVNRDFKLQRRLPTSVFWVYKKIKKRSRSQMGSPMQSDPKEENDENHLVGESPYIHPENLCSVLKNGPGKERKSLSKRLSAGRLTPPNLLKQLYTVASPIFSPNGASKSRRDSPSFFSLERFFSSGHLEEMDENASEAGDDVSESGYDEGMTREMVNHLDRIQRLDGLSNTKVPRSHEARSVVQLISDWSTELIPENFKSFLAGWGIIPVDESLLET